MAASFTFRSIALWSLMVVLLGAAFLLPEIEPTPSAPGSAVIASEPQLVRFDLSYSRANSAALTARRLLVPSVPPPAPPLAPSACICPDEPAPIIH